MAVSEFSRGADLAGQQGEDRDAPTHLDDSFAAGTFWQPADVAAQQELGILPQRRHQCNRIDIVDLVSDGTAVGNAWRASRLATICVFNDFNNLVMNEIVDEVVARLSFQQRCHTSPRAFESLHGLDPDGATVGKSPENVVGALQGCSFMCGNHDETRCPSDCNCIARKGATLPLELTAMERDV